MSIIKFSPVYLHFLDRELRRAEDVKFSDDQVSHLIITSLFFSNDYCYCSHSLLTESLYMFPKAIKLLLEIEKCTELVRLLTNEGNYSSFIESRQRIYAHKADRYPMYFNKADDSMWPKRPLLIKDSTTMTLRSNLLTWLDQKEDNQIITKSSFSRKQLNLIEKNLLNNRQKAVTIDLFLNKSKEQKEVIIQNHGRLISYHYTKRYLDLYGGTIIKNIPGLEYYDSLAGDKFSLNYAYLRRMLEILNIPYLFYNKSILNTSSVIYFIQDPLYKDLKVEFISLLIAYINLADNSKFEKFLGRTNGLRCNEIYSHLYEINTKLQNQSNQFKDDYSYVKSTLTMNKKVLIVVATKTEFEIAMQIINIHKMDSHTSNGLITYWFLGQIGNCELFIYKLNDMGSDKPNASALGINDAIKELTPDFVIMLGIAFGLKPKEQKLGQILISREIQSYESKKISKSCIIPRSNRIPSGSTLIDRFDNSGYKYKSTKTWTGLILSGEVLSDSETFVKSLRKSFPDAIGGEMEGTGLQSSSFRHQTEQILIKGICDWGYNKQSDQKEENQKIAMQNVCEFLVFTLSNFEF